MDGTALAALGVLALFVVAVLALWRSMALGSLLRGTRLFLMDWFGEPERPGVPERPGFPARMAKVEARTADLAHDFRGELTSRLTLLAYTVDRTHEHLTLTSEHVARLEAHQQIADQRITDHRRRNDEQIALLRESVARIELAQAAGARRRTDPTPEDPQ